MEKSQSGAGSLASMFGTDKELEKNGIELQYGDIVMLCARSGGANSKYSRALERLTKPVRRLIQTETLPPDQLEEIFRVAFAEAVVNNWWTIQRDASGTEIGREPWIEHPVVEGDSPEPQMRRLNFNKGNFCLVMRDLPDLFDDLRIQTNKPQLYKKENLEQAAGNS
jgi:hypothetical protein